MEGQGDVTMCMYECIHVVSPLHVVLIPNLLFFRYRS